MVGNSRFPESDFNPAASTDIQKLRGVTCNVSTGVVTAVALQAHHNEKALQSAPPLMVTDNL